MENDYFLPGSASLVDCVDKKLLVSLRDGKHYIGILRSYDQFVLQDTIQRMFHGNTYAEEKMGIYLIRGENVVLLGEIDQAVEEESLSTFEKIPVSKLKEVCEYELIKKKSSDVYKGKILHELGFSNDHVISENDNY